MAKKSRGTLSRRTKYFSSDGRRLTVSDLVKEFKEGDKVIINLSPYFKGAIPHPRYNGRAGVVVERRGDSYVVEIIDGNKNKKLISHPVHLSKV